VVGSERRLLSSHDREAGVPPAKTRDSHFANGSAPVSKPDAPLLAHSVAEVGLYLMLQPCHHCGQGPVRAQGTTPPIASPREDHAGGASISIVGICDACSQTTQRTFRLSSTAIPTDRSDARSPGVVPTSGTPALLSDAINPTTEPSPILDVADWLTLAKMLTESAARESDRAKSRQLRIEAGLCLDEALKFYDDDENDLPPASAFFNDASRARLRSTPQQFSRQCILAMRLPLPRTAQV